MSVCDACNRSRPRCCQIFHMRLCGLLDASFVMSGPASMAHLGLLHTSRHATHRPVSIGKGLFEVPA